MCHFVLVFFSPFSIAITSLGEERANLSAFRMFVRFVLVWICRFPLPLGVWEGLRFVIVALPGLFSYLFLSHLETICIKCQSLFSEFSGKLRKIFKNCVCWNVYSACWVLNNSQITQIEKHDKESWWSVNKLLSDKQGRHWSDAPFCNIWSGSTGLYVWILLITTEMHFNLLILWIQLYSLVCLTKPGCWNGSQLLLNLLPF